MRYVYYICAALLVAVCLVVATVPHQISYQGRLTDSEGNPAADGDYNLTFEIFEHDPPPMGETALWTSGIQAVTVTDGLFVYYLGSNVPLPKSIFMDDGLDSRFVRVKAEGAVLASRGIEFVAVPFAIRAASSDTAAYALSGPGSGATGWVDDGSVVRLQSSGDRVGIGTSSPSENLVVGGDLGSFPEANYIVSGNSDFEGYSGFKLGWNFDNHATIDWLGDGDQLRFSTRSMGTSYNNTMTMRAGNVGINNDYPDEPLVIGAGFGTSFGDMIQISRTGTGRYSGMMFGEDGDNRGQILWYNNSNELRLGYFSGGTNYTSRLVLKNNQMIVNGDPVDASVQLPTGSISSTELMNEVGVGKTVIPTTDLTTELQIISSRPMNFPAPGWAFVIATLEWSPSAVEPGISQGLNIELSESPVGPFESPYAHHSFVGQNYATISISRVFEVTSAGQKSFYLLGSHAYTAGGVFDIDGELNVIYIPSYYGTTGGSSPEFDGYRDNTQSTQTTSSSIPIESLIAERVRQETATLTAEFDAKLQALEEEFHRKLAEMQSGK